MSTLTRVLRTNAKVLTHNWYVGEDLAAVTAHTVTIKRLDGTAVVTAAAAGDGGVGISNYTLAGANTANLDTYTIDWTGTVAGTVRTERDYVEIVGGFLFELATARQRPPALPADKYPAATLESLRVEAEQEAERISHTTFVPRFMRVSVAGTGTEYLMTPHTDLRALRAVTVDGVAWTAPVVAAVGLSESGVLMLRSGLWDQPYPRGRRNIVLEYEHGLDMPPVDVSTAAIMRLRSRAGLTDTTVPYRATSFTAVEGGVYRLSTPSKERTGVPEVDATYLRYQQDLGGFA